MVVRLYIQIFLAWWVTTILYNYGATLCELCYNSLYPTLLVFFKIDLYFTLMKQIQSILFQQITKKFYNI